MALKTRIITASIAAPIAIGLIFLLPRTLFAEVIMLLMIVGLFEWDSLTTKSSIAFVITAMKLLFAGIAVYLFASGLVVAAMPQLLAGICLAGCLLWIWHLLVLRRGIGFRRNPKLELVDGVAVLFCAWAGFVLLRETGDHGTRLVLLSVLVVWAADIFAYAAGRMFGRHKLAPSISPGKTIEGVVGGLAGAVVTALVAAALLLDPGHWQWPTLSIIAVVAALVSVVGDLWVSRLKRQAGVKDSGRLFPGHGGLLDRIDGVLAALPAFAALWWLLN